MDCSDIEKSEFHMEIFCVPVSVAERDVEGFEPDGSALINEAMSMEKRMEHEVESEDVHERVKSDEIETKTEEL